MAGMVASHGFFLSWRNGAAVTTVDHADIRGLVTACLAFVVELPLAMLGSSAGWRDPIAPAEDSPTGAASSIPGNLKDVIILLFMLQSLRYGQLPI